MKKSVFISGANRGFGLALTQVFWGHGWTVVGLVRSEKAKLELLTQFTERCSVVVADVSEDSSVAAIKTHLAQEKIQLDVLIHNAGVKGGAKKIQEVSLNEISRSFNVHCLGAVRCVQGCLESLETSNEPVIINISSRLGSIAKMANGDFDDLPASYAYRVSKAALNMLTACLASELKTKGFRVHSIHPGKLLTDVGMKDADMDPLLAAQRTYQAVLDLSLKSQTSFVESGVGELPW